MDLAIVCAGRRATIVSGDGSGRGGGKAVRRSAGATRALFSSPASSFSGRNGGTSAMLHNETAYLVQRRLQMQGVPMNPTRPPG